MKRNHQKIHLHIIIIRIILSMLHLQMFIPVLIIMNPLHLLKMIISYRQCLRTQQKKKLFLGPLFKNYMIPYSVDLVDWIWKPMYVWNVYALFNKKKYANGIIGKQHYDALLIHRKHMLIWRLTRYYKTLT